MEQESGSRNSSFQVNERRSLDLLSTLQHRRYRKDENRSSLSIDQTPSYDDNLLYFPTSLAIVIFLSLSLSLLREGGDKREIKKRK